MDPSFASPISSSSLYSIKPKAARGARVELADRSVSPVCIWSSCDLTSGFVNLENSYPVVAIGKAHTKLIESQVADYVEEDRRESKMSKLKKLRGSKLSKCTAG